MRDSFLPPTKSSNRPTRLPVAPEGLDDGRGPDSHVRELLRRLREHQPGRTRYQVVRHVAQGGMGVVLEVWDEDLRRRLAMKSLRPREFPGVTGEQMRLLEERVLTRFLEEAQITGQLGHPGIVPLHEMGLDEDGCPYFTMPLVRGQTLADIIAEHHGGESRWSLVRVLGVLLKVCEAVAYAHDKGVIHRDLKPSNIMVGQFGEVYVMDWGLARVLDHEGPDSASGSQTGFVHTDRSDAQSAAGDSPLLTVDGDVVGTPAYMSPEQARGSIQELDERSDVYSLGCLLYAVLSGCDPYSPAGERASARAVLGKLLLEPPPPVSELRPEAPEDLVAVCERAMARDADERYPSAWAVSEDLLAFLERRPVAAHAAGLGHLVRLWFARHRAVATLGAIAAAVLVAATALFLVQLSAAYDDERAARAESDRRGDRLAVRALVGKVDELWPAVPERVPDLVEWIDEARDLLQREGGESTQAGLAPARSASAGTIQAFDADVAALRESLPHVEARLERARTLVRRSIDDHDGAWAAAIAGVASDERYGGLELAHQVGLVPLGPDPRSGLWEFWHTESGERPPTVSGTHRMDETSGLVLVLVPGGVFSMGSPLGEGDRFATEHLHEESVDAFFLSKYEVTQGQWLRATGVNPAFQQPGKPASVVTTLAHPVESATWFDSTSFARRMDLRLPTEVEWECAARGGTTSAYWWGDDSARAIELENLFDTSQPDHAVEYRHFPVGTFASNPFGFFDIQGNVSEWCQDSFWVYPNSPEQPLAEDDGRSRQKMVRGGLWYTADPTFARSAFRQFYVPRSVMRTVGVRVARSLRD